MTPIAPAILCTNGPSCCAQVNVVSTPGVPTLSEWAAILLSITLMGFLVMYNRRRDGALVTR